MGRPSAKPARRRRSLTLLQRTPHRGSEPLYTVMNTMNSTLAWAFRPAVEQL